MVRPNRIRKYDFCHQMCDTILCKEYFGVKKLRILHIMAVILPKHVQCFRGIDLQVSGDCDFCRAFVLFTQGHCPKTRAVGLIESPAAAMNVLLTGNSSLI